MFKIEPKDSREISYKKFKKYLQNQGIEIINQINGEIYGRESF